MMQKWINSIHQYITNIMIISQTKPEQTQKKKDKKKCKIKKKKSTLQKILLKIKNKTRLDTYTKIRG